MKTFKFYIFEALDLKSKAVIVKSWAEKYNLNPNHVLIFWKRAICSAIEDGKKGVCEPKDWGVVMDIFKMEIRKHYGIKDITLPVIKGQKVHLQPNEETIRQTILRYEKELKLCCANCPKVCVT